uniref:Uncharacterized protein n=1 Tax=Strombidium inclinatum TaxID=197538 RepID=A0A7S3IEQ3_9SPIT
MRMSRYHRFRLHLLPIVVLLLESSICFGSKLLLFMELAAIVLHILDRCCLGLLTQVLLLLLIKFLHLFLGELLQLQAGLLSGRPGEVIQQFNIVVRLRHRILNLASRCCIGVQDTHNSHVFIFALCIVVVRRGRILDGTTVFGNVSSSPLSSAIFLADQGLLHRLVERRLYFVFLRT